MRLALNLGYWGGANERYNLALAQKAERLDFSSVRAAVTPYSGGQADRVATLRTVAEALDESGLGE